MCTGSLGSFVMFFPLYWKFMSQLYEVDLNLMKLSDSFCILGCTNFMEKFITVYVWRI